MHAAMSALHSFNSGNLTFTSTRLKSIFLFQLHIDATPQFLKKPFMNAKNYAYTFDNGFTSYYLSKSK